MNYVTMKFVSLIKENIEERINNIEEALGGKAAKNYEEYAEMCGEIKGLFAARSFITDLTHYAEEAENE